MNKTWTKNEQNMNKKWTKNERKMNKKWTKHEQKINKKLTKIQILKIEVEKQRTAGHQQIRILKMEVE